MVVYKCKMCGGSLEIDENNSVAVVTCEYCGTQQTLPTTNDEVISNLYNRANILRLKCEFDKALEVYEKILDLDNTQAEAHWGIVLCKYGVEYVHDYNVDKRVPTCHRTETQSILTDPEYISTIDNADETAKIIYENEAEKINLLQKHILQIVNNEKSFDIFICYKQTDDKSGERTIDSTLANDIYYQLTEKGLKVFYSAVTLEDKLGQEYEPYIFAALTSSRIMLVVGTKPEYLNSVWVKNEWSRFLHFMKTDKNKVLIPCYRDMDAYDLPEDFSHLQALDMGKIGFMPDLIRGVQKILSGGISVNSKNELNQSVFPLLKRAFMFLEDGEFENADLFLEQVLNKDPENAKAYIGKMMIQYHLNLESDVSKITTPLIENKYFNKAVRFANEEYKHKLSSYSKAVDDAINEAKYQAAIKLMMTSKNDVQGYLDATERFLEIKGYKDADEKALECHDLAFETDCQKKYDDAENIANQKTVASYKKAAELLSEISGYKDSDKKIIEYQNLAIETDFQIKYNNAEYMANQKTVDSYRKASELFSAISGYRDASNRAIMCKNLAVETDCLNKYNEAESIANEKTVESYRKASELFSAISGYRDAGDRVIKCKNLAVETDCLNKYNEAESIANEKTVESYRKASELFSVISGYRDAGERVIICKNLAVETDCRNKYNDAESLASQKTIESYRKASEIFSSISGYEDADKKAEEYRNLSIEMNNHEIYSEAVGLMNSGLELLDVSYIKSAENVFQKIRGYNDVDEKIDLCQHKLPEKIKIKKYYLECVDKMDNGVENHDIKTIDDAKSMFRKISGYRDVNDKMNTCTKIMNNEKKYNNGCNCINNGEIKNSRNDFSQALEIFSEISGFRDSTNKYNYCLERYNSICDEIDEKHRKHKIVFSTTLSFVLPVLVAAILIYCAVQTQVVIAFIIPIIVTLGLVEYGIYKVMQFYDYDSLILSNSLMITLGILFIITLMFMNVVISFMNNYMAGFIVISVILAGIGVYIIYKVGNAEQT